MFKKLLIPLIIFILLSVTNINSMINAIHNHEKWRIIVACVSMGLMLIVLVLVVVNIYKQKNKPVS